MNLIIGTPGRKSRLSMLPLLVALFVISYGMLTTLVVLQDRTIDSQRGLIRLLFQDSLRLTAGRARVAADVRQEKESSKIVQVPSSQAAAGNVAPAQGPADKVSANEGPAQPKISGKNKVSKKTAKPLPMRPPAELTDASDMRRVTFSI
jgi:hypothetical protein